MKSVAQCIEDKDYKGLAECTKAAIFNKKKHEGQRKEDEFKFYRTDKSRVRANEMTTLERQNRGRV